MPDDFLDVPRGADAFSSDRNDSEDVRVVHLLSMATQALGSQSQIASIDLESDELGVPRVDSLALARSNFRPLPDSQADLDRLTLLVLRYIDEESAPRPSVRVAGLEWEDRVALWREVERSRTVESLLAFANFEHQVTGGLEKVAAAAVLYAIPERDYPDARATLDRALGEEGRVADFARAVLGLGAADLPQEPDRLVENGQRGDPETSVAIHGTWARLAEDRWYAPEADLHRLIRRECTPNLFAGDDYFRWTGGYSDHDRAQGSDDFGTWLVRHEVARLDTVFAHSHGANVALAAAAAGVRMRLLVLLHAPALPRSDQEWRRIRASIEHVVVLRTRLDYVVLGDGLRNGSSQSFAQDALPHRQIMPHVLDRRGWMSHSTFVEDGNWIEWDLAREIRYERSNAGERGREPFRTGP